MEKCDLCLKPEPFCTCIDAHIKHNKKVSPQSSAAPVAEKSGLNPTTAQELAEETAPVIKKRKGFGRK